MMFDAAADGERGELAWTVVMAVGGIIIRNGFMPDRAVVLNGLIKPNSASMGMPTKLMPHAASTPNRIASSGVIGGDGTDSDESGFWDRFQNRNFVG